jgi:hypothetical protein
MTREEELTSQGWRRQTTCDEPRLSEMAALYRTIGMDVHLEAFDPAEEKGCTDCLAAFPDQYKTIYTRPKHTHAQ